MKLKILQLYFISGLMGFGIQCSSFSEQPTVSPSPTVVNGNSTVNFSKATNIQAGAADEYTAKEINPKYFPRSEIGARVEEKVIEIKIDKLDMATVLQQPTPEIWFVFDCTNYNKEIIKEKCKGNEMKSELPTQAKLLIKEFWKQTLTTVYNLYSVENNEEREKLGLQHQNLMIKLRDRLKKLQN